MSETNFAAEEAAPAAAGDRRNHRFRRGVYLLPSLFTGANLFFGYWALMTTLNLVEPGFDTAARLIGLAILCDALDGRVARATRATSELGKQLDSLADVISFGLAPGALAYAWGARGLLAGDPLQAHHVQQFGWLMCFAFVICCAWRLARFNVHGMAPGQESRYFVGMPTPAAAGMVAATVHAVKAPLEDWRYAVGWFVLIGALGGLMASTIRYYGFKEINWYRRQPSLAFVLMGLLVASIVYYSELVLMLLAVTYTFSGFTVQILRIVRHRLASHPA